MPLGDAEQMEKFSRRLVKVTPEHNRQCQELLALMGVPFIVVRPRAIDPCSALAPPPAIAYTALHHPDAIHAARPQRKRKRSAPS